MFVFSLLYLLKVVFLRSECTGVKLLMIFSFVSIPFVGHSIYDQDTNYPRWLMAIPTSGFLIGQAMLDYGTLKSTKDPKIRVFYCLDHHMKSVSVYSNLLSTLVYCSCLFYWLTKSEINARSKVGNYEDVQLIHLSLGSIIFYFIMLIERVGMITLDLFQD